MRSGLLRERVTVRNPTATVDAAGQKTYSYSGIIGQTDTVWASVRNVSQSQTMDGDVQPSGQERFQVRIRYRDGIDYDTRLQWSSGGQARTLQVVGIENVRNLDHELILECEEADQ